MIVIFWIGKRNGREGGLRVGQKYIQVFIKKKTNNNIFFIIFIQLSPTNYKLAFLSYQPQPYFINDKIVKDLHPKRTIP